VKKPMSHPDHPVWGFLRIVVMCGTLLGLQLMTATSWDAQIDGEAGTLGGVGAMAVLMEYLRQRKS
jgi:hypothetical protein